MNDLRSGKHHGPRTPGGSALLIPAGAYLDDPRFTAAFAAHPWANRRWRWRGGAVRVRGARSAEPLAIRMPMGRARRSTARP